MWVKSVSSSMNSLYYFKNSQPSDWKNPPPRRGFIFGLIWFEEVGGRRGKEWKKKRKNIQLSIKALQSNKKKHKPPPPTPPVRVLQGLTLNIRGMTPTKWVAIQELPVFSTLDYIILTEHQLSAEFRPDEIWDFHAVSGTVTTLPQRGYRGQRCRGGLALFTRNSTHFSITMHSFLLQCTHWAAP